MSTNTVFFDGHCNLCNGFVDWLLQRDSNRKLHFASLQGKTAQEHDLQSTGDPESIIYLQDGIKLEQSEAVLGILAALGGAWKLTAVLRAIPRPVRDVVYRYVARNRYKFFGRRPTCRLPTAEEQARFLP